MQDYVFGNVRVINTWKNIPRVILMGFYTEQRIDIYFNSWASENTLILFTVDQINSYTFLCNALEIWEMHKDCTQGWNLTFECVIW